MSWSHSIGLYMIKNYNSSGYGQHGDYLFGWKDDSLQRAVDTQPSGKCANANCGVPKIQPAKDSVACQNAQQVPENVGKAGAWVEGTSWRRCSDVCGLRGLHGCMCGSDSRLFEE